MSKLFAVFFVTASIAAAYVQVQHSGFACHRTDNKNIQFLLNNPDIATLKNSNGQLWIAAGSDVKSAVTRALTAWNGIPSAQLHFAPLKLTTSVDDPDNPANIISFDSSAEAQMALNGAVALTNVSYVVSTGAILKTDILFSSQNVFSTNLTPNTYDLQDVITHELGHSLGANHTGILSATMFQAGPTFDATASNVMEATNRRYLHADDLAFATSVYPVPGNVYGMISGTLQDQSGNPIKGGLLAAADTDSGSLIGGLSSIADGSYELLVPPGTYTVWAEPLIGIVQPGNLRLSASDVTGDFQFSSALSPVVVSAGAASHPVLSVVTGSPQIVIEQIGAIPISETHGQHSIVAKGGPIVMRAGSAYQILVVTSGTGTDLTPALTPANLNFIGPISLTGSITSLSSTQFAMNVQVASVGTPETASLLITYKGSTAAITGALAVVAAAPLFTSAGVASPFSNAATLAAPGNVVTLFGSNMGPATGVVTPGFDTDGFLPAILSGYEVTFDGQPAPIFYAGTGQINVEVPFEVSGKASTEVIVSNAGLPSAAVTLAVAGTAPALYSSAVNPDYSLNTATNRIAAGSYVQLYCVGLGTLGSTVVTGGIVPGAALANTKVTVSINGIEVQPSYAGGTPGFTGLDQVNVQMPANTPTGQIPVSIVAGGQTSNTITVWVK